MAIFYILIFNCVTSQPLFFFKAFTFNLDSFLMSANPAIAYFFYHCFYIYHLFQTSDWVNLTLTQEMVSSRENISCLSTNCFRQFKYSPRKFTNPFFLPIMFYVSVCVMPALHVTQNLITARCSVWSYRVDEITPKCALISTKYCVATAFFSNLCLD